jgi:type II secretory pathway pseudopilin PulG
MLNSNNYSAKKGFYLIELLLAVMISSVLWLTVSVSFQAWWQKIRANALREQLRELVESRSLLARQLQHAIQLCGISQVPGCDNNWSNGWKTTDLVTHQVLERHPLSSDLSLIWKGGLGHSVVFLPTGRPDGAQGGWHCRYKGHELFYLVMLRVI